MININQTSENSKIYIQRNITNDEPVINNYITEDELQEILKEYNSIPYIVVDGFSHSSFKITKGDWDAVHNAIQNKKPYLIYARSSNSGDLFSLVDDIAPLPNGDVSIATTLIVSNGNVTYRTWYIDIDGNVELSLEETYAIPTEFKTINGNEITGTGDIIIEGGNGNVVELTQEEYDNTTPEPDTLYVITDAPAVEIPDTSNFVDKETLTYEIDAINIALNQKQDTLVSGQNIKTINNQSIVGSGNITIEGGGTEILYLWKLNGTTTYGADHNANVRNTLLSLSSSEEYPIIVVKDYNNDTICNNVYANASTNYVEIQCCNSRIGGTPNDLTDERYELLPNGMFRYVKNDVVATQNYVDEKISDINIESGGNIVELTQSEYNSITPEPDTLYLISDSNINTSLKTINGESIIGEGDIKIDADLTGYATTAYVDEQIGDINSVLENIIG